MTSTSCIQASTRRSVFQLSSNAWCRSVGGRVIFVASDVTADEKTKTDYYKVQILLDRDQLDHLPNVHLTPGMPVEAMVQLGERSFFRYITQPIRDSFHRAFHEQ